NDRKGAQSFFQTIFSALAALLACLVLLGVLFAPAFTQIMAWGFKSVNPDKFDLTVHLTRLMFPFLFFICLSAISAGPLNALGTFRGPDQRLCGHDLRLVPDGWLRHRALQFQPADAISPRALRHRQLHGRPAQFVALRIAQRLGIL